MTSFTPSGLQRQIAFPDVPALQIAFQRAQERITVLENENAALRQEIHWFDKLLAVPASVMSPSQKVTLRAATKTLQRRAPNEDGLLQIESWKLCQTVGQSKDTFLNNLTYLSENVGVLRKQTQRVVTEEGNYTTNLYIGATDLITRPEQFQAKKLRNHGGERLLCPHCQSDRLRKKVTITCMCCGAVLDEKISELNKEEPDEPGIPGTVTLQKRQDAIPDHSPFFDQPESNLTTDITISQDGQVDDPGEQIGTPDSELEEREPTTPPLASAATIPGDLEDVLQAATSLLVEIAGPQRVHIEMSSRGPKKYYDVPRALSLKDARDHLTGKKTKGAMVRRPDGLTRALCYDADTTDDWLRLLDAVRLLPYAGYVPLVEDSPAGRGGHLWIIFTDLVDARAAHRHVGELAPMLQEIKECWPGPGNHKVRLPGGIYIKPGFRQQCNLYDAHGALLADNGQDAALVFLSYQTPATIVPSYPPDPEPEPRQTVSERVTRSRPGERTPAGDQAHADSRWQQKYESQGGKHFWFQFTPQQLAAWYNERHAIEELLPPERNGMGLAGWRGERTASVGYTRDGQGWVDFGASTRRNDGKQDGGDALELEARISDLRKPEIMRQAARDLIKEARTSLESAARSGNPPPAWVQEILTPAGKEHYQELLLQSEHIPTQDAVAVANDPYTAFLFPIEVLTRDTGGVAGSCSPDVPADVFAGLYPPPMRASYCCQSTDWMWRQAEERYVCGVCEETKQ